HVSKYRLSVPAPGDQTPGDAHGRAFLWALGGKRRQRRRRGVRPVERVAECRDAFLAKRIQLRATSLEQSREFVAHASLPVAPCLRNASMKGSMSPSMTFCTSGIFN